MTEGFNIAQNIDDDLKMSKAFEVILEDSIADKILVVSEAINLMDLDQISNQDIKNLAKATNVDGGIFIIGPDRKIKFSDIVDYVGWEYPKGHAMDPVFNGQQETYMEAVRADLIAGTLNKYGGMKLKSNGYYVQIGINATTIADLQNEFSYNNILADAEAHEDVIYALMIDEAGLAYAGTESMLDIIYDDEVTLNATQRVLLGQPIGKMTKLALPPMMFKFHIMKMKS